MTYRMILKSINIGLLITRKVGGSAVEIPVTFWALTFLVTVATRGRCPIPGQSGKWVLMDDMNSESEFHRDKLILS